MTRGLRWYELRLAVLHEDASHEMHGKPDPEVAAGGGRCDLTAWFSWFFVPESDIDDHVGRRKCGGRGVDHSRAKPWAALCCALRWRRERGCLRVSLTFRQTSDDKARGVREAGTTKGSMVKGRCFLLNRSNCLASVISCCSHLHTGLSTQSRRGIYLSIIKSGPSSTKSRAQILQMAGHISITHLPISLPATAAHMLP